VELVLTAKMGTETVVRNSTAAPRTEAERGLRALSIYCLLCALGGLGRSGLELARLLLLRPGLLLLSCGVVSLLLPPIGLLLLTPLRLPGSLGLLLLLFGSLRLLLMLLSRSLRLLLLLLFRSLRLLLMLLSRSLRLWLRLLFGSLRLLLRALLLLSRWLSLLLPFRLSLLLLLGRFGLFLLFLLLRVGRCCDSEK
jgi:hypothetical protein